MEIGKADAEDVRICRLAVEILPAEERDAYLGAAWLKLRELRALGVGKDEIQKKVAIHVENARRNERFYTFTDRPRPKRGKRFPLTRQVHGNIPGKKADADIEGEIEGYPARDQEIIRGLASGSSRQEIARKMECGLSTIYFKIARIRELVMQFGNSPRLREILNDEN